MKRLASIAAALALTLSACADAAPPTLTVFAASSLTDAFERIARTYEDAGQGVRVRLSLAGSGALARQIRDGAPADVFASADEESMAVVEGATDGDPIVFARNQLTIAVAAGNPLRIARVQDLSRPQVTVVVCAPEVPCGRRTQELLNAAGVRIAPASREDSVRSVLTKLVAGEADAGIVYRTDVRAARSTVEAVEIPDDVNVESAYPIAVLTGRRIQAARAFVSFVTGPSGRRILAEEGFLAP